MKVDCATRRLRWIALLSNFPLAVVLIAAIMTPGIYGCGGGNNQPPPPGGSNPTPTITTISQNSAPAGSPAFTLTINGTNFIAASTVNFGGTALTPTFVSATQLTAVIPAAALALAGTAAVTVTNPTPGGGTSNAVNFTIANGTNPTPTIVLLAPSCSPRGEQVLNPFVNGQLLVDGQDFVAGAVVRWNGSDRPTTFFSNSQLTAQISTSDIAATGTAAVTVFNPAPGGGSSNTSTFTITAGGVGPESIAVDRSGKFAYVANQGCGLSAFGNVSMYTIDAATGALTSIGPPVPSEDEGGRAVAVDHFGKFAYVANWGEGETDGSVSAYTINATTGSLTPTGTLRSPCAPPPSPGSCAPWSVATDPSGMFVYVANEGGFAPTSVSMYTADATTGVLTFIGTVAVVGRAISVAVDPTGKFAYVANESDPPGSAGNVSMFTINAGSGGLTFIGTIPAGTNPDSIAIDPSGAFAYVTNSGSNSVSTYSIDPTTGALTLIGTVGT